MRLILAALLTFLVGITAILPAAEPAPTAPPARSGGPDQPPAGAAAPAEKTPPATGPGAAETTVWMRKKLDYTQQILGGIAEADFDRIARHASSMKALSRIEGFVRGRTPGYRTQLQIFQDATEELLRQAEKENVDGAALAFTQLTLSCVNCHKQLREAKSN